ncbi:LysM peptidoglycan-binding domain-containing protein [Membranihabitans marinus]|uniref:LysM peptidoglycan-binding domain-containing protein n=1 Tax=Membranihabitans marinus TaxID=1227546 RepID=UPI001F1D59F3|nr:LysM peptidoglycan-binding domain-containing protein [Membranihabitans marinus]
MICHTKNILTALLLTISVLSYGQVDGLEIKVNEYHQPYIIHTLAAGQTLYGVSKTYQISVDDLMKQNEELEPENLKIGQDIFVPIFKKDICYLSEKCQGQNMVALKYKILPQDNLFRIARIYFDTSINQLKIINRMDRNHITPGEHLLIGWIPYSDYLNTYLQPEHIAVVNQVTPEETAILTDEEDEPSEEISYSPKPQKVYTNSTDVETTVSSHSNNTEAILPAEEDGETASTSNMDIVWDNNINHHTEDASSNEDDHANMVIEGATAYWNKNKSSKKGKFILHKTLPLDSMVEIYNPVTHASVVAKVVGNIPDNIYSPEIELVVTTEIANALGALDKKFYTKIRYSKN